MSEKFYTSSQAAKRLKIEYSHLDYLHRSGKIFSPKMIGKIRVYTEDDIRKIEQFLNEDEKNNNNNREAKSI